MPVPENESRKELNLQCCDYNVQAMGSLVWVTPFLQLSLGFAYALGFVEIHYFVGAVVEDSGEVVPAEVVVEEGLYPMN